ncbi:MAG: hypothetical protein ACYDBQ_01260 [Thermoplasmatota archaeon]
MTERERRILAMARDLGSATEAASHGGDDANARVRELSASLAAEALAYYRAQASFTPPPGESRNWRKRRVDLPDPLADIMGPRQE